MKDINKKKELISNICASQYFGVLATSRENKPYTTIVAFVLDDDLQNLYFSTPRDTKKFSQLSSNKAVSFLVHNSSNNPEDLSKAVGITITGKAFELPKKASQKSIETFLVKHPQMKEFIHSENTAFIGLSIERYDIVERFQNVTVLRLKSKVVEI